MGYGQNIKNNNNKNNSNSGYGSYLNSKVDEPLLPNTNPHAKGTIEHDQWNTVKKDWNKNRGIIYGTSAEGFSKTDAHYYNNDKASGLLNLSKGGYDKGTLAELGKEKADRVVGDRKKVANYAIENGLYTPDDWDSHEIKDKTMQWLWKDSDDIDGIKEPLFNYLKTMKEYGFSEPELKALAQNKKKELINTSKGKNQAPLLAPPLTKKPLSLLPTPDPIEQLSRELKKPVKQGQPLDIPTPLTLDNEEAPIKTQGFPKMDYGRDYNIGLDKNPLGEQYDLKKAVSSYEKDVLPKKIKRQNEYAKNTYQLDSLVNANLSVDYDDKSNTFDYKLTDRNKSYDSVINELYGISTDLIDKNVREYAKKKNISGSDLDVLRAKARTELGLPVDDILKEKKENDDYDNLSQIVFGNSHHELPQSVKDIGLGLNEKLEQLRILRSKKAFGQNTRIEIPKGVNPEEFALSLSRGVSPSVLNNFIEPMAGIDFDVASSFKNIASQSDNPSGLIFNLLTDPRKIFSKEYTDSEAMNALVGVYQNKYQFSPEEAKEEIQKGFKDIDKERDTWGHATSNLVNSMGELTGELIGPFKLGTMGFDKVLEKGAWVQKFVEGSKIGNLMTKGAFKNRALNIQRAIEGKNTMGGGVLPYFDEVFGFAPTNVARVTAASFGSQMFWHGGDVDEAIASAENMAVLETFNQSFALSGMRGYKFFNTITKALRKSKGTQYVDDLALGYQKKLNAIYALSSFPAQGLSTAMMNPEATDKEFASELLMNLMMTGNNFVAHRGFNKQLKEYNTQRTKLENEANNWANESPNREVIKVTSQDLMKNAEQYKQPDKEVSVSEPTKVYNRETNKVEDIHTVAIEKVTGFHDYAREVAGKKDKRKKVVVNDFRDIVKENIPEDLQGITDKIFDSVGGIKIETINDPETTSPAYYDKVKKTIVFNNAVDFASNNKDLTRAVVHEGIHALTDSHYANDKKFRSEVDNITKDLIESEDFQRIRDEYENSEIESEIKAYNDLTYAMQSPEEMMALMFDPGMKEGRDAISKLEQKRDGEEKPKTFIDRMWDILKNIFKNKDGQQSDDYIKRFRDIVEGYDYETPIDTKKENKSNTEPIQRDIDEPILFMPELVNTNKLNEYNEVRKQNSLPELSSNEMVSEYRARYGTSPNGIKMDFFMDLKKREMLNKSKGEDSMSTIVNDINKAEDKPNEGFIDKSEIKFAKEVFGTTGMAEVYVKLQGKSAIEISDQIKRGLELSKPKANSDDVEKIATYTANRIAQTRIVPAIDITFDASNGYISTSPIRTDLYQGTKPVDKTIGESHYLNNFFTTFPKSFRTPNGELRSYVPEVIDKFFSFLNADNLHKIGGINGSTKISERIVKGDMPIELIGRGYFLIPKGTKNESLLKIPGLDKISRNPERAINFGKEAQRFNFFRWLDSDSQWIGSKEGVFTGRKLADLGGKLDFDLMIDKYISNHNVPFKDLFTEAQTGEINTDNIDLIGSKLKQYYMDAGGRQYKPFYKEVMSNPDDSYNVKKLINETIKDLLHWRIDAGGGSRTIEIADGKLKNKKAADKYEPIADTNDPVFLDANYMKPFISDAVKEDGSWNKDLLKEYGYTVMEDGNLGQAMSFPNELMFAKSPLLSKLYQKHKVDGGTLSIKKKAYDIITDAMGIVGLDPALHKPKMQRYDENGNMFTLKTAIFDYAPDEYSKTHHKEYHDFMKTIGDAVTSLSFDTSTKGSNTYRMKQEKLLSVDTPNARALFDNSGNIQDVIVKKDGEYKSDKDLFEKELGYMQDQWAKGIVDPRSIIVLPVTGKQGITFLESSHGAGKNGGALGFNQNLMFNPHFEAFKEGNGPKAYEAIEKWEDNVTALSKAKIEGAYGVRDLLEGVSEFNDNTLKKSGEVINDVIEDIKGKIEKGDKDDDFMLPGLSNKEALELLESTLDSEGKVIPQNLNNLFLAGNLFVNGMKNSKPGEKTMLQYQIRDYFTDALLTRGYGTNLYLMPDLDSKASIARAWEPMIEDLIERGEMEKADAMSEQYLELMNKHIDENGQFKPFSNAVIVGYDVFEKFNLELGGRAFAKNTPADDLHSLNSVVVIGVSNKPGALVGNAEFLAKILGKDYDKDSMQLLFQNDKYISKEDFDTVWDHWNDIGMTEGRYKLDTEEYLESEKTMVNGVYRPLGDKIEAQDPTMTPQSKDAYDRTQDMNGNVGTSISLRNLITNGNRNLEWTKEGNGVVAEFEIPFKNKEGEEDTHPVKLRLKTDTVNGKNKLAYTSNAINNKMVDRFDHMPFDPSKAIFDQMIESFRGKPYESYNSEQKASIRNILTRYYKGMSGYNISDIKKTEDLKSISNVLQNVNIGGKSVASKVGKMMTSLEVPVSNRPEINKYLFNNKIGQEIQKATIEMEKELATQINPKAYSAIFNGYKGSPLNVGQHIQSLFAPYTINYLDRKASPELQKKALDNDIFSYISTNDFGAFTQGHKWKDIAAGTVLYDYYNKNTHKHPNLIKNKVFRGGYEYQYDGYTGWITKGENKVKLGDIFGENGDLKVDWLDGNVLSSQWMRDLVQRKSIVSDNAKAELIGRTIGNVAKLIESKIGINSGELFTMLAYNSTGNVQQVPRKESTKLGYDKSMYNWIHGYPKNKKYDPKKLKAISTETSKEMRYDPLYLMQGAKSVGVNPIVKGKDALSFMKDLSLAEGEAKYGKINTISNGERLGMPELRFRVGGLNINSPKSFMDSVVDLIGKAETDKILDKKILTEYNDKDYAEMFDKVLDPALRKLIKKKGTDLGWKNETIELATRQYINNFGPRGMDAVIENIKRNNSGETKDFKLSSAYVGQLAILGHSLDKQFKNKEGTRLSFLRPFGNRTPIAMLKDYTLPENMKNFSGDHIIAETFKVRNGKVGLVKNEETGEDIKASTHYKVSDIPNEALNISSANMTLPKSYIEFVEPRNYIEKVSQGGEANIKDFKDNFTGTHKGSTFKADTRSQNNESVSEIFSALKNDETLTGILNEVIPDTAINGIVKSKDSQVGLDNVKLNLNGDLKELSDKILDKWADKEIEAHKKMIEEDLNAGRIDGVEAENITSKKDILARAEEYRSVIENAIRIKGLAHETANTLIALAETAENAIDIRSTDIDDVLAQEVYVATKRVKDKAKMLLDPDIRNVLTQFRSLDYKDGKTIDMFNEIFYDNSQKHMNEYKEVYDTYKSNWSDSKYILTPDKVPFVFDNLYAKDNIPLFPYLANRFLKHIKINEIESGNYDKATEKSYKAYTKKILRKIEPDMGAKELDKLSDNMWNDLKGLTQKRFNINTALYEMGHKMGLTGHETPLAESEPENVFKSGYKLRKELTRQYENKLKGINDFYEIDMVDFKEPNLYMNIEGREIDLEEVAVYARPHLVENPDIFKFSVSNFKDKVKSDQNSVISAIENAFKTSYIKKYPNEGKVAEAIVMSELGKVTNDKAIYNQHYDKNTIKKANIEPGTDSYVRYMTKSGRPITAYGRILGTRDIVTSKEKNFDGTERVETNKFLFLQGERQNGGKMYVINTDNIHDAVTGQVYGGRYSQPVMYNKKVKEVYSKNTSALLDDIAKSLSEKSKFDNRKASDKYVEMVDRNTEVRENVREKRMDLALEGFQDAIILSDKQLEKSFPERLKNGQKLMKDLIIADTYMGLRYISEAGAGLTLGATGLATGNIPLAGYGVAMVGLGAVKYGKRIGRIMISNLLGNLGWVSRNTNDKRFLVGNAMEIYNATRRNLGIGQKDNIGDNSDAIAKVERLELEEGIDSNRAAEMLDEAIYENDNLRNKSIFEANTERKQAKLYGEEIKRINEQMAKYKEHGKYLEEPMKEFMDQTIKEFTNNKKFKDATIEFKNNIPFINGKALTHYQTRQLTLMNLASHLLSWKGHFIDYEIASTAKAQKNVKAVLDEYYHNFEEKFGDDDFMFRHNLNTMLSRKSIGDYKKSAPQRNTMNSIAETFSRFSLLQKLDQTTLAKERYDIYNSIMGELKKDKKFQQFKEYTKKMGGLPLNDYKIQAPKKELAFNLGFALASQAAKIAGLVVGNAILGNQVVQELSDALDTNEDYFGTAVVANDMMKVGVSLASLMSLEDGKSPRSGFKDLWWSTGTSLGGFTGYGTSTAIQEALVYSEILMYSYYHETMSYSDKKKVEKYMGKLEKEKVYESVSKVAPIPVVNALIKKTPQAIEAADKDK